jgi:hypothetical protein
MAIRNDFAPGEVLAAADLNDTFGSKLDLAGGKILQIVRQTLSSSPSTGSSTYVDTGFNVSITPQFSTSTIWLIASGRGTCFIASGAAFGALIITDSSNNQLGDAAVLADYGNTNGGIRGTMTTMVFVAATNTSARTYKTRFLRDQVSGSLQIHAGFNFVAIEVSA